MSQNKRIQSKDGNRILEIVVDKQGLFCLREFARRYDSEEEVHYEVEVYSNVSGKYADFAIAYKEAKRLIDLES